MSLFDRSITPYLILATAGWVLAVAIVVIDLLLPGDDLGHLGLVIGLGSATLNVRGFVHREECRIKEAFEFGRDSVRMRAVRD